MQQRKQKNLEAIVEFIDNYRMGTGLAPSMTEIAKGVGLTQGTVSKYVAYMRQQGIVDYDGGIRGIRTKKGTAFAALYANVPVVGEIACGSPIYAEENIREYVQLPESVFGHGDFFLLRARGESMTEAGIDDGDLVLVRKQDTAEYNQIVAALIGEDATLKRYRPQEDGSIVLHPENVYMRDIVIDAADAGSVYIQGVVTKIIKEAS